jgi:CRISPR-associated protein Cas2
MWLFAMFDLPVTTRKARKRYAQFRKLLLEQGFSMLQFSVYARFCASEEMAAAYRSRIRAALPPEGYVRVLGVTDRQFGKMESYIGENWRETEAPPSQLALF